MDHMMPGMDGIETTAVIRTWEKEQQEKSGGNLHKQIPIIALTANAVVGMREMFIESGFNDYLSKPIDVSKLDDMLNRWIPEEKRAINNEERKKSSNKDVNSPLPIAHNSFPVISGIDVQKGISMTGGTIAAYTKVLALFCKDIEERLPLLQKTPDKDTLSGFITQVHALKSASASVGAEKISIQAAELEASGKSADMAFIHDNLSAFTERLKELTENISTALHIDETAGSHSESPFAHFPLFEELAGALKTQKISEIKRVLNMLFQQTQDSKLKEILEQISDQVLMTEFDKAAKIVEELVSGKS